jgi:hypothetical protein
VRQHASDGLSTRRGSDGFNLSCLGRLALGDVERLDHRATAQLETLVVSLPTGLGDIASWGPLDFDQWQR